MSSGLSGGQIILSTGAEANYELLTHTIAPPLCCTVAFPISYHCAVLCYYFLILLHLSVIRWCGRSIDKVDMVIGYGFLRMISYFLKCSADCGDLKSN